MRITFVHPTANLSGGCRVVAAYAERLGARGHGVTVVSTPPTRLPWVRRAKAVLRGRGWGGESGRSHFDGLRHAVHRVIPHPGAVLAADVPDADVIVAAWWRCAEWIAGFPASKGRQVYFVQGYAPVPGIAEAVDATWRLPMAKIVVSRWLAEMAARHGERHVIVVPNATDFVDRRVPPREKSTRPRVGFVYSPWQIKGPDVCIAALERLRARLPDVQGIAFGVEPSSRDYRLPSWIQFELRPTQERIAELYAACDAWILGSRSEGFGLPILEAFACRTPVVSTPVGAAPELLAGGGGRLVPMADVAAAAVALEEIIGLPNAAWRSMSDRAYGTALRYNWDDATDQFEDALLAAASTADMTSCRSKPAQTAAV